MSYEVERRSEVEERLRDFEREDGIDSVNAIRRAHGSSRRRIHGATDTGPLALDADASPGQLAADYAALARANEQLSQQLAVVNELIADARRLARPMNDGHGPIASAMRIAFAERAEDADGAVRALVAYRDELTGVIHAIRRTMEQYQRIDADLAQAMVTIGDQHA